jgi:hypothetical protein
MSDESYVYMYTALVAVLSQACDSQHIVKQTSAQALLEFLSTSFTSLAYVVNIMVLMCD